MRIPKEYKANREKRKILWEGAAASFRAQQDILAECKKDLLFWVNLFGWTFDPRKRGTKILPFITWPFQDQAMLEMAEALGRHDVGIEKSRDMGATWMLMALFLWRLLFYENETYLLVSRTEDYVDKPGDPKTLFWKLDFMLKRLPGWMTGTINRTKKHIDCERTQTTIDAEATTADIGRGGRYTAIGADEVAAWPTNAAHPATTAIQGATNCCFWNSTPQGLGAFYELIQTIEHKIRLHWTLHPEKSRGLEIRDGQAWSPWYDKECRRLRHPWKIAQELDICHHGAAVNFFPPEQIEECMQRDARPPYYKGELEYSVVTGDPVGFLPRSNGHLWLWLPSAMPSRDADYVIGVDVSAGQTMSNSTACVWNRTTGEKVAEYAHPKVKPHELAKYVVALCRWFRGRHEDGAYLIWEANGHGEIFGKCVLEAGYGNVYLWRDESSITKKVTMKPGWYSNDQTKKILLDDYRDALGRKIINHSIDSLRECLEYSYNPSQPNSVVHLKSLSTADPSGARSNHGDRVIADALAYKGMKERGLVVAGSIEAIVLDPPLNSRAWREKEWEEQESRKRSWCRRA